MLLVFAFSSNVGHAKIGPCQTLMDRLIPKKLQMWRRHVMYLITVMINVPRRALDGETLSTSVDTLKRLPCQTTNGEFHITQCRSLIRRANISPSPLFTNDYSQCSVATGVLSDKQKQNKNNFITSGINVIFCHFLESCLNVTKTNKQKKRTKQQAGTAINPFSLQ